MTAAVQATPAEPAWTVGLLGGFRVRDGGHLVDLSGDAERLVAFLALQPSRVPRAFAAGSLWTDCSQHRAFGNLRATLFRLRRGARGLVTADTRTIALGPDTAVDIAGIAAWGDAVVGARPPANGAAVDALRPLGTELLPGWDDEWTLVERERIRQLCLHRLEELADELIDLRRYTLAIQAALMAIGADPLRESAHRRLIRAHLAEGNTAEALRAYRNLEQLLAAELGIAPTRSFAELAASVHHLVASLD